MRSQTDFDKLQEFCIGHSGDTLEKLSWPKVSAAIPSYESFWREFIVLLTERIDPNAPAGSIRLRSNIPEPYERLLMANYSTFSSFVAASAQVEADKAALRSGELVHPELFFFQARRCVERYDDLRRRARIVFTNKTIGLKLRPIPEALATRIRRYRNAFTHDAYLGRGQHHGRELVVNEDRLPKSKQDETPLWSAIATYPRNEMTRLDVLEDEVCAELAAVLESAWRSLTSAGLELRIMDDFIRETKLLGMVPVGRAPEATAINSISASGANVY